MNEDRFNIEVRKFLKEVGITSQREIEGAVRRALEDGRIGGRKLDELEAVEAHGIVEQVCHRRFPALVCYKNLRHYARFFINRCPDSDKIRIKLKQSFQ